MTETTLTERCAHGAHEVLGEPGHGECRGYVIDPTTGGRVECSCDCHGEPDDARARIDRQQGFEDGREWAQAAAVGDTIALPTDPSPAWADGFAHGRINDQRDYEEERYNADLCPLCDYSPCVGSDGLGSCGKTKTYRITIDPQEAALLADVIGAAEVITVELSQVQLDRFARKTIHLGPVCFTT